MVMTVVVGGDGAIAVHVSAAHAPPTHVCPDAQLAAPTTLIHAVVLVAGVHTSQPLFAVAPGA
jgi:hypothetical protein